MDEIVWSIKDSNGEEHLTRKQEDADRAHAAGLEVQQFLPPAEEPDPKAPLHSIQITTKTSSPYSAEILIDGKQSDTIQAIHVDMSVDHANRVTIVCEPEQLEIKGPFEGWARPDQPAEVLTLLEKIRDLDEQTSDGAIGSLARRAIDLLPSGGPTDIPTGGPTSE